MSSADDGRRAGRTTTRVLIVDDHQTFAQMLAMALSAEPDFESVGTADNPAAAVEAATRLRPDMVVLDIRLGRDSGLNAARPIRAAVPEAVMVVVSAFEGPEWVVRAARAGQGDDPAAGRTGPPLRAAHRSHGPVRAGPQHRRGRREPAVPDRLLEGHGDGRPARTAGPATP